MSDSDDMPLSEHEDCMQTFGPDYPDLVDAVNAFELESGSTYNVGLYEEDTDFDDALLDAIHDRLGHRLEETGHDPTDIISCARRILHQGCHYERLLGESIYNELSEAVNEYVSENMIGGPSRKRQLVNEIKELIRDRIFPNSQLPPEWNKPVSNMVNEVYSTTEEEMTLDKLKNRRSSKLHRLKNTVKALFSRQKLGRGQKSRRRRSKGKKRRKKTRSRARTKRKR